MKSGHQFLLAVSIAGLVLFSCCTKTSNQPPEPPGLPLEGHDWKITGIKINPALNGLTDIIPVLPDCEKDNLFQFRTNGAFYHDENHTSCSDEAPKKDTGTWYYDRSSKFLRFSSPSVKIKELTIKTFSADSVSGTDPESINGSVYTYSITFTRQE